MLHKYNIIYADPPWEYDHDLENLSDIGGGNYPSMPLGEIKSLPIKYIANKNCVLFLWVTMPKLREGLEVMEAWGFRYLTCAFTWVKTNSNNMGIYSGLGHWTKPNAELCLLGEIGEMPVYNNCVPQVIFSPMLGHSRKPSEVKDRIVALVGNLPRIELFARHKVEGWDTWGNEVPNDIDLMEIKELI